jgi:hypothetical protein
MHKGRTRRRRLTDRDQQDLRRLLRVAGGREGLIWEIDQELARPRPEDLDDALLPGLIFMEENFWKYERSPKARRIYKQRVLELRQQEKDPSKRITGPVRGPMTREENVRMTVNAAWQKGWGQSKEQTVRRLTNKLRAAVSKLAK